jgi:hypothetical protein
MHCIEMSGYNYSKNRCRDAVFWFLSNYLPNHKITVSIHHRGMVRDGVKGWISVTDYDWRPREFEIEMHNKLTTEDYITTLLHELWHLYQHVNGSLRDKRGKRFWRGIDHSDTEYSDQPWEIDAYKMEKVLYNEYLNPNTQNTFFSNRLTTNV